MDDLKPLAVFAETVDAGSMSAAARRLGMSASAVSQAIRALERQAGLVLLHRSTRRLALTEAGERYYPHCRRLVEAARDAAAALQAAHDAPTGELRIAAPMGFADHVAPALATLLAEAPRLRVQLQFADAMIDLVEARIDLAIRVGRLADSNWVARRLGDFTMALCASPAYLDRHGVPAAPADLAAHQWLAFARVAAAASDAAADGFLPTSAGPLPPGALRADAPAATMTLRLHGADGERRELHVAPRIACDSQLSLQQFCEQGLGIARLGLVDARAALRRGALVRVLPDWRVGTMPVWAVTPERDGGPARVRAALAHLQRHFAALTAATP